MEKQNAVATQNAGVEMNLNEGAYVEMVKASTIGEWLKKNAKYWNNGTSSSFNEQVVSPMWECKKRDLTLWLNDKMYIYAYLRKDYARRKIGNLEIGVCIFNTDGTLYKTKHFGCNGRNCMYINYANNVYAFNFSEIEEYITQCEKKQEIAG